MRHGKAHRKLNRTHEHRAAMFAHDLAHGREPQAIAGQTRREKRFEDTRQRHFVHAPSSVAYGNAHIAPCPKVPVGERSRFRYLMHLCFNLDAPHLIHCLRGVVAKIENHLLQLSGLTGYDGRVRHLADGQFNPREQ